LILNKKEKEKRVIELADQGKTTRGIAKEVNISLRAIFTILNKMSSGFTLVDKNRKSKMRH
jgi:hypothetical protein